LAFLAGLGLYGCYLLLTPFLSALAWALAFAVIGSPLHHFLERRIRNPHIAAGLSVAIVACILILPALLASEQIIRQAIVAVQFWTEREPLEQFPILQQIDVEGSLKTLAGQLPGMLRSSVGALTQLPVSVFCLFFFFRDRKMMAEYVRSWLPLSDGEVTELSLRISDILFATILGRVTLAGIQGTLGGVMFLVLGLPTPLLWGLVMAFLALIPFVGASLVWGPAAAYLVLSGNAGKGLVLALWGLLVVSTIDNVLYPFLVGARVQLHPLATFFGVLGGIALFGPAGLILGPVILATTSALLEVCRRRAMALGVAEPEGEVVGEVDDSGAMPDLPEQPAPPDQ
jgi:predicted PurR-regulated permease PerM